MTLGTKFRYLWASTGSSNLADGIFRVGVPLLAVTLTRSPLLVAAVSAATTLPWLLFSLHAGAIADRLDRRQIMMVANGLRACALVATAGAVALDLLSLPLLLGVVLVAGIAEVFSDTAAQSVLPMTVDSSSLGSANGRIIATQTVGNEFAGAPLAGVLVGVLPVAIFGAPALLYAAAGLLLIGMRGRYQPATVSKLTLRHDIAEGLRYLLSHRTIRTFAIWAGMTNAGSAAFLGVFVLWVVGDESAIGLSPSAYGLVMAVFAAGAVGGSLVAARLARLFGEVRTVIVSAVVNALMLLVPVILPSALALFLGAILIGATAAINNVVVISLRQRIIPEELLGRVNSAYRLIGMGGSPLGAAAGGALGEAAGLRTVFFTAVAVSLVAVVMLWHQLPELRSSKKEQVALSA